jgi:hypothetical protein
MPEKDLGFIEMMMISIILATAGCIIFLVLHSG